MIQVVRQSNSVVTDYYLDIIAQMVSNGNDIFDRTHKLKDCSRDDIVIVPTASDFLRTYRCGFRKIIYWVQGLDGEESYLKHHGLLRKKVLDFLTCFALKNARAIFYVSEEMQKYLERKFRIQTTEKAFIMPCFNVTIGNSPIFRNKEYKKNIFSYVGSLSEWQCFPQTVDFYKNIEMQYKDTEFRVFTFSKNEAEHICKEKGIKHYSVTSVAPDEMTEALKDVKFGFVLRDNIAVNNVATPTKLSSYMAAGVIPIFSDCIKDFNEQAKNLEYVVPVSEEKTVPEKLLRLCTESIDASALGKEYADLFDTYYNPEYYIAKYSESIKQIINP